MQGRAVVGAAFCGGPRSWTLLGSQLIAPPEKIPSSATYQYRSTKEPARFWNADQSNEQHPQNNQQFNRMPGPNSGSVPPKGNHLQGMALFVRSGNDHSQGVASKGRVRFHRTVLLFRARKVRRDTSPLFRQSIRRRRLAFVLCRALSRETQLAVSGRPRRAFSSARRRSTSASRSRRVSRSPMSSVSRSTSAVATASL